MLAFQDPQNIEPLVGDDYLGQLPPAASTFTPSVDGVYYFTLYLCAFFFFLIMGILLYSVIKWRRRTPDQPPASMVTHNTALEVTWTVIPLVLIMILFAWGWKGSMDMTIAPANCLQYEVKGYRWAWEVKHPGALRYVGAHKMYVPVNQPVKVKMYSDDVLHSFFIPAMRVKRDVLPGRYQMVWFQATREGTYPILCTEYCGKNHSFMLGTLHVVSQEEFDAKPWAEVPDDPIDHGEMLYMEKCMSCHSNDGTDRVGPTFTGLFGREEGWVIPATGETGTVVVDMEYFAESIREPQKKIVKGFEKAGDMTKFDLSDQEINALAEYIKSPRVTPQ